MLHQHTLQGHSGQSSLAAQSLHCTYLSESELAGHHHYHLDNSELMLCRHRRTVQVPEGLDELAYSAKHGSRASFLKPPCVSRKPALHIISCHELYSLAANSRASPMASTHNWVCLRLLPLLFICSLQPKHPHKRVLPCDHAPYHYAVAWCLIRRILPACFMCLCPCYPS